MERNRAHRNDRRDPQWGPSQPNPAMFQIPKSTNSYNLLNISKSTGNSSDLVAQFSEISGGVKGPANEKQTCEAPFRNSPANSVAISQPTSDAIVAHGIVETSSARASMQTQSRGQKSKSTTGDTQTNPRSSGSRSSKEELDVYAEVFVPQFFLAINQSPAVRLRAQVIEGIDFENYISTFAGSCFKPSTRNPSPSVQPRIEPHVTSVGLLTVESYGKYFENCLFHELEAQETEIRTYDMFGADLQLVDQMQQIYTIRVPGLREGAPVVDFGDTVMLRQLVMDPITRFPRGMDLWLAPGGGREKGEPAPGFTGYQIDAAVFGVDKVIETVYVQANGIANMGHGPVTCNVSFLGQIRTTHVLQRVAADIAEELQRRFTHTEPAERTSSPFNPRFNGGEHGLLDARNVRIPQGSKVCDWLHSMLFPCQQNAVMQQALPSVNFSQIWVDSSLNYEQKKAVDAIQRRNYGQFCYLINGPPGTGKTKTICETVHQIAKDPAFIGSILICAPSNPAADTIADRLRLHFGAKSMLRLNSFSRTFAEVPQTLLPYCYVEKDIFNLPPVPVLMAYKIVVTTCRDADILIQARLTNRDLVNLQQSIASTLNPFHQLQKSAFPLHWSALVIDEAAQATEPETLIPLTVVTPPDAYPSASQPTFVMAGDQHQLNPRTYDRTTDLHVSLFERISTSAPYDAHPFARSNLLQSSQQPQMIQPPFVNLFRNYRSHPAILAVPSSLFYSNTLTPEAAHNDSLRSWKGWRGRRWPVLFACNSGMDACEDVRSSAGGWYNMWEAEKAITYAQDILRSGLIVDQREICIMSPFRAQIRHLRDMARKRRLWELNIGPMEAFQGLESRFVIICTTRARKRFLTTDSVRGTGIVEQKHKFNVAITRAKDGLIVIGNPYVLATDVCWLSFMQFCWRNALWEKDGHEDDKMQVLEEANVNYWTPPKDTDKHDGVQNIQPSGLEGALVFRQAEKWQGSNAAKRFMGGSNSTEDVIWESGLKAEEELRQLDLGR